VLRDAGYVETRRGRGAGTFVVADLTRPLASTGRLPSTSALRDLVDWRRAVGGETAALAARRADEPGRRAILEAAAAVEVATRGDFSSYRLADAGFHVAVAEVTGSGRLIAAETAIQAELGEILAALPGTWSAQALQASTAGHAPIETAIVRADPVAARDAMLAHVESTFDWIVGLHLGRLAPDA